MAASSILLMRSMMTMSSFTPQITAFHCQPENHHPSTSGHRSHGSLKLRRRQRFMSAMVCRTGGSDVLKSKKKGVEDDGGMGLIEEEENNWKQEDVNEKVELMEREAIMGKDDGREAMDYKRRAAIFYKSSEMFLQSIKDDSHH